MLFSGYLTVFTALASCAAAEYSFRQGVTDIQDMTSNIYRASKLMSAYDGGFVSGVALAKAIYSGHQHAIATRMNLHPVRNFTASDGDLAMGHVKDLIQAMGDGMRVGAEKAPLIKEKGLGYIAQGMLLNLYQEKNAFEEVMRSKATEEQYRMCEPELRELDQAFEDMLVSFR